MSKPISAGDLAIVISGANGASSPNIGLIVKVLSFDGDHSVHGRMWRCDAEYAVPATEKRTEQGHLHFAQSWLKKIEPPESTDSKHKKEELVIS